jgi:hypothetical protein
MSHDLLHSFPSQEHDEAVFVFARPYWLAFVPTLLIFLFLYILTIAAQIALSGLPFGISAFTANMAVLGLTIFQLAMLIVFLVAVLDFYFDIIVVTDQRLVDIDQEQLFYRKISELNLKDIEDTSFVQKGFFQTYFSYGNITIQTAGEATNFIINNLKHPAEIARIISDLADQAKDAVPENQRKPIGKPVGIIENEVVNTTSRLVELGAMQAGDPRVTP